MILSVASQKGGTGKTTTSISLELPPLGQRAGSGRYASTSAMGATPRIRRLSHHRWAVKATRLLAEALNAAIGDEAARVFAGQFYSSIGFGYSVQIAYDRALAQLRLEDVGEDEKFELHTRDGIDPADIVLVRPLGLSAM